MSSDGLWCECSMPLSWRVDALDPAARQRCLSEAGLLLNAFNQIEVMPESGLGEPASAEAKRVERMEAKLDLALHLLARALEPGPLPPSRAVRLSPQGVSWDDAAPPAAGSRLLLELHPSPALPLALRLPVLALEHADGMARAVFSELPSPLEEALHQFVFRRHRQAIRDKSLGKTG